ncbi:tungsten ABC transporter substrate-binding protein [candidate division KSB1 bacterium]|nr:MAG: tungsten ABC transporter substrate-binding protein [candidate division KSB1 bacterium]
MKKVFIFIIALLISCSGNPVVLKMASTTSIENTGLTDILVSSFKEEYDIVLYVIAVGTGKALELGKNGDVDLVFVHAPDLEKKFVKEGFGVSRRMVMFNDFVIVGPESDPAGVKNAKNVTEAFKKIMEKRCTFVSRGDNSGTNIKERYIWKRIGVEPAGPWYIEVGQGMGNTLNIASEKKSYCLTDRSTFYALEKSIDLQILFEGDSILVNPYHIIAVNPEKFSYVKYREAKIFIDWLTSEKGQKLIGDFKRNGKQIFHPYIDLNRD